MFADGWMNKLMHKAEEGEVFLRLASLASCPILLYLIKGHKYIFVLLQVSK
jgi:hypothetical protein